ncbi:hypothetical protein FCULG_00011819 [Fusarium culmorum]|uniref:Uncharacterized protein n=1 Tax=Fusarium culmorum TaxID=5516 RepID=A0A2T4GS42_FUSCU|nr:hypothetical protein FCULG_00011819 [Fusarium culmorum]
MPQNFKQMRFTRSSGRRDKASEGGTEAGKRGDQPNERTAEYDSQQHFERCSDEPTAVVHMRT